MHVLFPGVYFFLSLFFLNFYIFFVFFTFCILTYLVLLQKWMLET